MAKTQGREPRNSMPRFPAGKLVPKENLKGLKGSARHSLKKTANRKARYYREKMPE